MSHRTLKNISDSLLLSFSMNSRLSEIEGSPSSTAPAVASSSYIRGILDRMMEGKNRPEISSYSSPTSVVTVPLTTPNLQSRVILDTFSEQQGTEVTLLEDIVPRRCFADEFLDEEEEDDDDDDVEDMNSIMTPSPSPSPKHPCPEVGNPPSSVLASPATPYKIPLCGMAAGCWKQSDALTPVRGHRDHSLIPLQNFIVALLGKKDGEGCWRKHISCRTPEDKEESGELEAQIMQQKLLKRNPDQCKANKTHLHDLRRNLGFGQSPKRAQLFRSTSHQTVQSARKAKPRKPLQTLSSNKKSVAKTSLWQAFACHQVVPESVLEETIAVEVRDGYDSDPEYFGRTPTIRSPGRIEPGPVARRLFTLDVTENEEKIHDMASFIFNEKWTLILHEPNERPKAYHVWLERGQRLAKKVVSPKLAWKPLPKKGGRSGMECVPAVAIDILDVQRILKLDEIPREEYSLAKTTDSFLLKTIHGNYCWQASSSFERDRLTKLWKLTVARFGSMLITGDDDGMEEFFVPSDVGVFPARR